MVSGVLGLAVRHGDMSSYLLVHSAWCGGWVWDEVARRLEKAGHRVTAVDLPSAGTDAAALGGSRTGANSRALARVLQHFCRIIVHSSEPALLS
jgi:pimeloyl-ACP methyl ester carboxylesterase